MWPFKKKQWVILIVSPEQGYYGKTGTIVQKPEDALTFNDKMDAFNVALTLIISKRFACDPIEKPDG